MLDPGIEVGHYRVLRLLGSGGMADVYEALDLKLGRRVALKMLPPALCRDTVFIKRFEKEVRLVASLSHHGIVTIFEVGRERDHFFYSMRLLPGGDLRPRIHHGMQEAEAICVLRAVTEALAHAHRAGLVHRDIKPGNILFDENGAPVLTDFGIAKTLDQTASTQSGVSVGTPRYISPEQATGKPVDGRTDLYSLGVVFYEMLTGRPPYEADDALALVYKHVSAPVPSLPPPQAQFQPLIDKLLAKDAQARPASADDLIATLNSLSSAWPPVETRRGGRPAPERVPPPAAAGAAAHRRAQKLRPLFEVPAPGKLASARSPAVAVALRPPPNRSQAALGVALVLATAGASAWWYRDQGLAWFRAAPPPATRQEPAFSVVAPAPPALRPAPETSAELKAAQPQAADLLQEKTRPQPDPEPRAAARRKAEEMRLRAEALERDRLEQAARQKAEEDRRRAEALETLRLEEAARKAEEERQRAAAAESERQRQDAADRAQQERQAEAARAAELKRQEELDRQREAERQAELKRKQEEEAKAEQERLDKERVNRPTSF